MKRRVLNVGGGSKSIPIPDIFDGWEHYLLDVVDGPDVDIVLDARKLKDFNQFEQRTKPGKRLLQEFAFDAVYCSHCLEHFYVFDVPTVLAGFHHVLVEGGAVYIAVPNLEYLVTQKIPRLHATAYESAVGPISYHDMIFGYSPEIQAGAEPMAHHTGFFEVDLRRALVDSGFHAIQFEDNSETPWELRVMGKK